MKSGRMQKVITALALLNIWALLIWPGTGDIWAQEIFNTQLTMPNSIIADDTGEVTIHSKDVSTTLLTTFDSNGNELVQASLGSGPIEVLSFMDSFLAQDPLIDRLYLLSPEGDIVVFILSTLQEIGRFNIQDLTVDTNAVYDIVAETTTPTFALSSQTTYGDIAVFRPNDGENLPAWFITGLSNDLAFVMRIGIESDPEDVTQAEVILMSSLPSPFTLNRPRGIAVNDQGIGVTTLPVPGISNCPDAVVRFSATALVQTEDDAFGIPGSAGVPSWGVGMNPDGFYLATGGMGNADCLEGGGGRLVFIPNALTDISAVETGIDPDHIIPLSSFPLGRPGDIAIGSSPVGLIYMTIPNLNIVVRFRLSILSIRGL